MPTDDRMILYPFDHLLAIVDDPDSSEAALAEMQAAGLRLRTPGC